MTLTNCIHLPLACAAVPERLSLNPYTTIKRWNSPHPRPGYEELRQEFSDLKIALNRSAIASRDVDLVELSEATMPKNLKPLRKRGAGAAIGEIESEGNHEIDDFNVPCMRENHSHSTSLPTISNSDTSVNPQTPQSPFRRGFVELLQSCNIFKFEMQGEGA